ncbi:hypothetical protein QJS10_CPA01g01162 [Acorus calamus]|uniref:Chlorophyll a-b binding protein, chloroplastic n=1 Tax=Acorus calamus TaxID=4465 RepID=A0AAV9FLA2_ACOCL|nr:hypothetical protein QJS10_CPA01g01162 [Acorus calamus]
MASRAAIAAASRAGSVARLSSPSSSASARAAKLIHRRGLAGGGDHHGPAKINFWQDPLSPSMWKEEQIFVDNL